MSPEGTYNIIFFNNRLTVIFIGLFRFSQYCWTGPFIFWWNPFHRSAWFTKKKKLKYFMSHEINTSLAILRIFWSHNICGKGDSVTKNESLGNYDSILYVLQNIKQRNKKAMSVNVYLVVKPAVDHLWCGWQLQGCKGIQLWWRLLWVKCLGSSGDTEEPWQEEPENQ